MALTQLSLDTMATISQMIFSDDFLVNEEVFSSIKTPQKFVPKGPIYNNPALV